MEKQVIVAIGRQYGSGGNSIGKKIAEKLDISFYDRNLLEEVAHVKNADAEVLERYDEKSHSLFFKRTVRGYSSSQVENIADLQFALLRSKAADDDSFVICGRCADTVLQGFPGLIRIFIRADDDKRVQRIMNIRGMSEAEAKKTIARHDKTRRIYHNHFCPNNRWGESGSYDIVVNSSVLGIDGTADMLVKYIEAFKAKAE